MPESPREILKYRLACKAVELLEDEHDSEVETIRSLLQRSTETGESNSVLLIGPRGCGKTTLVQKVLLELLQQASFANNTQIISLSGIIHLNDRVALKAITGQLNMDAAAEGKTFGSFAENLAFLLKCLQAGAGKTTKSVIFILDEFDLFCAHHNQTLLYNLFDVAQSAQAPICVLGITHRLDVVELLEKRVKSRFSHRQIFMHSQNDSEKSIERLTKMLQLPKKAVIAPSIPPEFLKNPSLAFLRRQFEYQPGTIKPPWNGAINELLSDDGIIETLQLFFDLNHSLQHVKNLAFEIISLDPLTIDTLKDHLTDRLSNAREKIICSLSVLEVSLLIAMKHHTEIYDGDPFNFEMIFGRFMRFANASTTMQGLERISISKAFEQLRKLELIAPIGGKAHTPFQLHSLLLRSNDIKQAVAKYPNLPVEISQWALSSVV